MEKAEKNKKFSEKLIEERDRIADVPKNRELRTFLLKSILKAQDHENRTRQRRKRRTQKQMMRDRQNAAAEVAPPNRGLTLYFEEKEKEQHNETDTRSADSD